MESPINHQEMLLTPENAQKRKISIGRKRNIFIKPTSHYHSRYSPISSVNTSKSGAFKSNNKNKAIRNQSSCLPEVGRKKDLQEIMSLYYSSSPMSKNKWGLENSRLTVPKSTTSAKLFKIMEKREKSLKFKKKMPKLITSSNIYGETTNKKINLNLSKCELSVSPGSLKGTTKGAANDNIFVSNSNYKSFENVNNYIEDDFLGLNLNMNLFTEENNHTKPSEEEDMDYKMLPKMNIQKTIYNQEPSHAFAYHSIDKPGKDSESDSFRSKRLRKAKKAKNITIKPNGKTTTKKLLKKIACNSRTSVLIKNNSQKWLPTDSKNWLKELKKTPKKRFTDEKYASELIYKLIKKHKTQL
ncbi:unnamed protein product [Moneuplotes crassus]|uniref:Uncharacterized protein n=1 Tax=Euplotes crassus TaxID=5936 RepID=A0AAD1UT60_EUPCR|nr:unnamed protein product [Moneuplotes crassus]